MVAAVRGAPQVAAVSRQTHLICSPAFGKTVATLGGDYPMSPSDRIQALLDQKSRQVWSVSSDVTVYEAIAVMSAREVGALPVVDGGKLVGMLSERDYARKVMLQGRSSRETTVADIMSTNVLTITPTQTVEDGMMLMTDHRVRHLPVMSGGDLVGIVSIGDLVNWVISAHREEIHHLKSYISAAYPA